MSVHFLKNKALLFAVHLSPLLTKYEFKVFAHTFCIRQRSILSDKSVRDFTFNASVISALRMKWYKNNYSSILGSRRAIIWIESRIQGYILAPYDIVAPDVRIEIKQSKYTHNIISKWPDGYGAQVNISIKRVQHTCCFFCELAPNSRSAAWLTERASSCSPSRRSRDNRRAWCEFRKCIFSLSLSGT